MKVHVNMDICLLHGQCVIAAPEIFSFDDSGDLHWVEVIDDSQVSDAEAASDACPEQAIILG
ncbi:MAG: ferredoxin [Thioclava marina]|uniref:ferredoxin n=1 Tax=Thioclava marina TaxID=1915077 RepID=UPI00199C445A|nr:ferredoxin [Thioclava marina]MBC7147424.1 ferredoxin [Thioclava marina]